MNWIASLPPPPRCASPRRTQGRHLRLRHPLVKALALALGCLSLPAAAQLNQATYEVKYDGTAGFDPVAGPGFDTGNKNGVVRTHDEYAYEVTLAGNPDQDIRVQIELARGPGGTITSEFGYLPNRCQAGRSTLSADRQRIDCHMGDLTKSGTLPVRFVAHVLGTVPNDTQIPPATVQVSSRQMPALSLDNQATTLTVSAAPFYDVFLENSFMGNPKAYGYYPKNGPTGQDGFYHRPLVGLIARHPNGHGKKGVEQLRPDAPVDISLDISGFPPSVRVDNWHVAPNFTGADAASGSFGDGCGNNFNGRPGTGSGSDVNVHDRIRDRGPIRSTASNTVAQGGDCSVSSSSRDRVMLSLTGIDTTLKHSPTETNTGRKIPASDHWVANKALVLWTELNTQDYPVNTDVPHTLAVTSVNGQSISGQPIRGLTNTLTYPVRAERDGTARKLFSPDDESKPPLRASPTPSTFLVT